MTTLLTAEEVDFLRSVKKSAVILFAMILIDQKYPGRSVRAADMAGLLEIDERTAEKYMVSLAARNRMLFDGRGYVLTEFGRALLLGKALPLSPVETMPAQSPGHKFQALEQALSPVVTPAQQILPLQGAQNVQDAQNVLHTMCALEEEERISILDSKDSLSSTSLDLETQNAQDAQNVLTARILAATTLLFGEPGVLARGLDLPRIPPQMVLGWIKQAWAQKARLRNPAGLVYVRLKALEKPRAEHYTADLDGLPEEFQDAIGLLEKVCPRCEQTFTSLQAFEDHRKACIFTPAAEYTRQADTSNLEAETAWEGIQKRLKAEMPKSAYDTWVRDTWGAGLEDGRLTVGVQNAYARDWLEGRLAATMQAYPELQGMAVAFVVASKQE